MTRPEHPPLSRSARADALADEASAKLQSFETRTTPITDDDVGSLFALVDRFHEAVFDGSDILHVQCARGCSNCCSQVVFDVHAFEVDRIGRRLVATGRADTVRARLEERHAAFDAVRRDHPRRRGEGLDAWVERLAIEFWKQDRPCALLAGDGSCSVHDVRPWSCRCSFAANDPSLCRGEAAHDRRRRFFTLAPDEGFDEALAALDRWAPFEVDTDELDHALLRWLRAHATT